MGILRYAQNDELREGQDPPLQWMLHQIGICRLYKNRSMSSSGTRSGREGSWGGRLKIGVGSKIIAEVTKDFAVSALLLRCPVLSLPTVRLRRSPTAATRSGRFTCHRQRSLRSPRVGSLVPFLPKQERYAPGRDRKFDSPKESSSFRFCSFLCILLFYCILLFLTAIGYMEPLV